VDEIIVEFKGRAIFQEKKTFGIKICRVFDESGCTYDIRMCLVKDSRSATDDMTATRGC